MKIRSRFLPFWITALAAAALAPLANAATIFSINDVKLDGATGENTFLVKNGNAGATLATGSGTLAFTSASSGSFAYFVGNFGPVTLANVGDKLTITYAYNAPPANFFSTGDGAFRLGLFNSNGTQLAADVDTISSTTTMSADTGYIVRYRTNTSGSPGASNGFYQRTSSHQNLWESAASPNAVAGSPTFAAIGTGAVTGSLTLELTAPGQITLTSVVNAGTAQFTTDSVAPVVTTFDQFSFFTLNGAVTSPATPTITFTQLTIDYSPVPEPGAAGLLGACLLGLALTRRRSR
jgi:hypothetical protein